MYTYGPPHGRAKARRPARTYIQLLCKDTRCSPEDLPEARNDREKWRERIRDIRACGTTWWWWWWIFMHKLFQFGSIPYLTKKRKYNKMQLIQWISGNICIYICIYVNHHHHHHHHHHLVVPSARISLNFSHRPSLSFIASSRSPRLYPVS